MKRFIDVIKKNIFYIALIAGMAALVALVAMYNVKMESKEKNDEDTGMTSEVVDGTDANEISSGTGSLEEVVEETLSDGHGEDVEESMSDNVESKLGSDASENNSNTANDNTSDNATDSNSISDDVSENETNSTDSETAVDEVVLDFDGTADIMWPLNGNILIPFSMDTTVYFETLNEYKCNPGLVIEASAGDIVQSVYKSLITEVGSTPEYGNYVKASLGNGYVVMYAGLADISVSVNQVVEAGVTIGTVAEPTRYFTAEGPNLYFAITKDGVPVDPASVIE